MIGTTLIDQIMRNGAFVGVASFATISPHAIIAGREDLLKTMSRIPGSSKGSRAWGSDYHAAYDSVACTETLQCSDGVERTWELADPCKLLQLTLEHSPRLQHRYGLALQRHECTVENPWHIWVGFDEFAPGNKLSIDNRRKCMCCYYNFLELGQHTLSQAATWLVTSVVRHSLCQEADGGWSAMLALLLRRMFLSRRGFGTAGVPVLINGAYVMIYAKLGVNMSDGDGMRMAYLWKGASGLKACLKHSNVLKRDSDLAGRVPGYVEITCHDPDKFIEHTTQSFHASVDLVAEAHQRLQAGAISVGLVERIEKTEGFNYHPKALPYDQILRDGNVDIFAASRFDWVHSALQDGCMSIECHKLIAASDAADRGGYTEVEAHLKKPWKFITAWQYKGKQLHRIFSRHRANSATGEHEKLKATASEVLGMYIILRHWVETELGEPAGLEAEFASFKAACHCIHIIMLAKKQLLPMRQAAGLLRRWLSTWMRLHIEMYGTGHVHPKFHWMFDVCNQMEIDAHVYDQFIIERLHLAVKPHAERCDNTRRFERSVLSGVINSQLRNLGRMRQDCTIMDNQVVKIEGFHDAELADQMNVLGMTITVGDIVLFGDTAGRVLACATENNVFAAIVDEFRWIRQVSPSCANWQQTEQLRIWRALELEQDCFFGPTLKATQKPKSKLSK